MAFPSGMVWGSTGNIIVRQSDLIPADEWYVVNTEAARAMLVDFKLDVGPSPSPSPSTKDPYALDPLDWKIRHSFGGVGVPDFRTSFPTSGSRALVGGETPEHVQVADGMVRVR